jgi:DNA-directed RNA polymerase alpha subunit
MDFFVVPTIGFDLLYAFVIVRPDRRELVWINVTRNPTAAWVARQITEAFPWERQLEFRADRKVDLATECEKAKEHHPLNRNINNLALTVRSYSCRRSARIVSVAGLVEKTECDLLTLPNFGRVSLDESGECWPRWVSI